MSLRSHDHLAMPMCAECHRDLHCLTGRFAAWSREDIRQWQLERIEECRFAYAPMETSDADLDENTDCF